MKTNLIKIIMGLMLILTLSSTVMAVDWKTSLTIEDCLKQDFSTASGKISKNMVVEPIPVYSFEFQGEVVNLPYCEYDVIEIAKTKEGGFSSSAKYDITQNGVEVLNLKYLKKLAEEDSKYQLNYDEYKEKVERGHLFNSVISTSELNKIYDEYLKSQGKDGLGWEFEEKSNLEGSSSESTNIFIYLIIGAVALVILFFVFKKN